MVYSLVRLVCAHILFLSYDVLGHFSGVSCLFSRLSFCLIYCLFLFLVLFPHFLYNLQSGFLFPASFPFTSCPTSCAVPSPDLSFQPDEHLEVYVSASENPHHFWIQILGVRSLQLDKLTQEMSRFYSNETLPVSPVAAETAAASCVCVYCLSIYWSIQAQYRDNWS